MVHYRNLISALGAALPTCMTWKLAGKDNEYMNARDVFALAVSEDGENEQLGEGQFYMVSEEGAIGLAVGYEHLTRWFLIPLTGDERERELRRLYSELDFDLANYDSYKAPEPQAAAPQQSYQQAPPQGQIPPQQPYQQMPPQGQMRPQQPYQQVPPQGQFPPQQAMAAGIHICRNCGAELKAGAKFCKKCGTPVQ